MLTPYTRLALVLGLLSAVGPFAIDMYLPALPTIGAALHADPHAVQMSLAAFFASFALSQIVYGSVSDIVGRKPPLLFGIVLFIAGSIGCALAPDIGWLVAFRFVQGLGAGAPSVVPRAIVRDLHTGPAAARLLSLLLLVLSVSPLLAPLFGSLVIGSHGWRPIFWAITAIGAVCLALAAFGLAETRLPAARKDSSGASAMRAFALLLRDRRFVGLTGIGGFGMAGFFAYLANSSFVFIGHFGLSPRQYSLAFALNAASFIGVAQFTGRLTSVYGLPRVLGWAAVGHATAMVGLLALQLAGVVTLPLLIAGLLIGFAFTGLLVPTSSVLAMDEHGRIAGAASALMATLQMALGAAVVAVLGIWADGTPGPMVAGIAASSLCALLLAALTLRSPTVHAVVAEPPPVA